MKPTPKDVVQIFSLIHSEKNLIHLTIPEIRKNLTDFRIIELDSEVVCVGWLQRHSQRISEIRSLVTKKEYRGKGYATTILKTLLKLNTSDRVIAISNNTDFFNSYLSKKEVVLLDTKYSESFLDL